MTTNEKMDRGTDAMKAHLTSDLSVMEIRQTRRGFCQELMGCEARTEFKYFVGDNQIATSLEDAGCCCRIFCTAIHPFKMEVKELNTEAELLTVDRPCACAAFPCKCCCYQEASFTSGGQPLGSIKEDCYYCVVAFKVFDESGQEIYYLAPPTCCGGICFNFCTEGNPCGKGCCKLPFRIYPPGQRETGSDAPYIGKILKKPKSAMTEVFTDANAFEVTFPNDATTQQKAILVGTSIFLNAAFFEGDEGAGQGS